LSVFKWVLSVIPFGFLWKALRGWCVFAFCFWFSDFYCMGMKCIVTAGPTYEELDDVRRLTNFSSGKLGSTLANFLVSQGHEVTLLLGHYATWHGEQKATRVESFSTTTDLQRRFEALASPEVGAVFHAAAVSDFTFGKIWSRSPEGTLTEVQSGKFSTRSGTLLAELTPTPKLIQSLRTWFPKACIVGWKYEVEGSLSEVLAKAERQIRDNKTNACVANGPAYGKGFGVVTASSNRCNSVSDSGELFQVLASMING